MKRSRANGTGLRAGLRNFFGKGAKRARPGALADAAGVIGILEPLDVLSPPRRLVVVALEPDAQATRGPPGEICGRSPGWWAARSASTWSRATLLRPDGLQSRLTSASSTTFARSADEIQGPRPRERARRVACACHR